ncbi:cytosine permease [Protaetiibacter intestinalis]|uniref:Cytosine permease n=1 Tax=Protaetiibacter intestinalis TaxID=2419774 RepID=A0A387BAN3_9MICO|nr:cytosine permease [Protaetiibacter intestinalis]AYF98971.1 hypothetical protein D7I47_12390 [Protaetiibacter intestinalis]
MTEGPPDAAPGETPDDGTATGDGAAANYAAYPPPFGGEPTVSDDDLAAALAAQTAMYTGPITIPVLNSDPVFRPDPAELQADVPPPPDPAPPVAEESDVEAPVYEQPSYEQPVYEQPVYEQAPSAEWPAPEVVLPPVPVPPPPPPAEYIAPDVVAADPEPPTLEQALPPTASEPYAESFPAAVVEPSPEPTPVEGIPLEDFELSREVENEAAAGSTLDAILLLENELRRRQGLAPVEAADTPPVDIDAGFGQVPFAAPAPEPPAFPVDVSAEPPVAEPVFVEPVFAEPVVEAPPSEVEAPPAEPPTSPPGWTPAPDPENEGSPLAEAPAEQAWLSAPPPSFAPPALVEPPVPPTADPAVFTPPPVDVSTLPPPPMTAGVPVDFHDAPPPVVAAVPITPPAFEALIAEPVVDPDMEGIDALDRADLAAPIPVDDTGIASVAPAPVVAAAVAVDAPGAEPAPAREPDSLAIEQLALEPTPLEQRAGHAARLFWLWFAANSSFVMVAVGATLFGLGMSLRQVLVAVVAGVALSALPLGLGTLAGKWSGQPTMVVSRATFGLAGNVLPVILAVLGRVLWGGVSLWLLAGSASVLLDPGADAPGLTVVPLVTVLVGAVLAGIVAVFGYGLLYRVQRVFSILSTVLLVATIALTAEHVDVQTALETDDGSWVLAIGGVVIVFSVVGLAWAQSSSDLARYQRASGSGGANMLWGSFGVILPTLLILGWGALLAASDPELADGLARHPIDALLALVPDWFVLPLFGATALGLLSSAIVTSYSGGLAVVASGLRAPRPIASLIAAVLVGAAAVGLLASGSDTEEIVRDLTTTLAVPVAAWAGIFASEMMIRLRRFHAPSLLAPGGVYPQVRWVSLVGLVVISVVGLGLTSAELPGLDWQGYLLGLFGLAADDPWRSADAGVLVALALGLILPLATAIPVIRRQERPVDATASGGMPAVDALVD